LLGRSGPVGGPPRVTAMTVTNPAPTFDALFNFRDLGGYRTADDRTTVAGRVYRSDGMHRASIEDLGRIELLGITRVVDLRTTHERTEDGGFDDAHPTIEYRHVPIFERLSGIAGARAETVDENDDTPLLTTYRYMLTERRALVVDALEAVAGAPGPVVFHCTAGKDRTGIVAALLLSAVGVPDDTIIEDYARSRVAMERLVDWYRVNRAANARGSALLDERAARLLEADPDWMRTVLHELRAEHGTVRRYLIACGATPTLLEGLYDTLVA
jgi:protein-tyrosine phosphatase